MKQDFLFQNVGFPWCPSNFGGVVYMIMKQCHNIPPYGKVGEASDTVDGSEIPANQLRLAVDPTIYQVLNIPGGAGLSQLIFQHKDCFRLLG